MTVNARQKLLHTFTIDFSSAIDDRRYVGKFTVKKLSIRDLAALGVRKAQLNGGMYYNDATPGRGVDESTDSFNNMIAHLEIAVKEAPEWWNLDEVADVELIGKVFQEVMSFENSFLARKLSRTVVQSDGEGSGEANISSSNNGGSPRHLVGQEVSSALEP